MSEHASRKGDHLDLCASDQVAFQSKTTLFEQVQLVHDALPEMAIGQIDLSTSVAGLRLEGPLVIAAMTGGIERAETINKELASVAQELGLAFGFGSMRPLLEEGVTTGYLVRDVAPDAVLFGNIGVVQAARASTQQVIDMVGASDVNALCIHLNPAQEVVQPEGDDDFRGGMDAISRLVSELPVPVIVKETGCGLSRSVGARLVQAGVKAVDVGGAGGTSWVAVETLRARAASVELGKLYWDWGIPTAASVAQLSGKPLDIIATGGVSSGLDIARAIALGARAAGMARPFLMAWNEGGREQALAQGRALLHEVRIAMLLTGSSSISELQLAPMVLGPDLARWVPKHSPLSEQCS